MHACVCMPPAAAPRRAAGTRATRQPASQGKGSVDAGRGVWDVPLVDGDVLPPSKAAGLFLLSFLSACLSLPVLFCLRLLALSASVLSSREGPTPLGRVACNSPLLPSPTGYQP